MVVPPCGHVAKGIDPNGPVGVTSPPEPLGQSCQGPAGLPGFIVEPHAQDPTVPWRCICSKQHGPGLVRAARLARGDRDWLAGFMDVSPPYEK